MLIKTACSPAGMLVPRMGRRCAGAKMGCVRRGCHVPRRWRNLRRASSAAAYWASTCDAARNDDQEQDIECDVKDDGNGEVVQHTRCVAECAQDGGCCVIEELREHTEKGDAQIETRHRDKFIGGGERGEEDGRQYDARRREENGKDEYGDEDTLHEPTQTHIFLFPIEMGDEDAESRRKADEEVDDDGEDEARCADRCERLCTECLPDERRVGNAVELLEELREQDGQHEYEQLPENRPACKVLLIGTVEEQDVQMMQVVMEKVIGERVAYAVDPLAAFECVEFAEDFVHKE